MDRSEKQSFYEIQLSNSHLIVAFLLAVGLGVAVFYSGVVVGRRQAPVQPGGEDWTAASPAGDEEGQEAGDRGELEFPELVREPVAEVDGGTAASPPHTPALEEAAGDPQEDASEGDPGFAPSEPAGETLPPMPQPDPNVAEGWVVQVKSTQDRQDADALQVALAAANFPAFVVTYDDNGGPTWYRVRVGRYASETDAAIVARHLDRRSDIESTWVTRG